MRNNSGNLSSNEAYNDSMKTFKIGRARVSAINLGNLGFRLKDEDDVPEDQWGPNYSDVFEKVNHYPSQCFLIILRDMTIIVDAGDYSRFAKVGPEYVIAGYKAPPDLSDQLRNLGVPRENVNYVVITHGHLDHYAGVTMNSGSSSSVVTFPRALHLLGKQDFESTDIQSALRDSGSIESETLGILLKKGLLELVEEGRELSDEVEIIAAPGETPGHKILKLQSGDETLYCVGDLFHHAAEVENITWMAKWADRQANLETRKKLIESALKENAIIAAAHMPVGRIQRRDSSLKFVEL
jgi:glyoxylase-like metal-dependent hydrolase (beta-lactamase superfamily II)